MLDWLTPFWILLATNTLLWMLNLRLRDASIVDLWWGPMFVLIAAVAFAQGEGHPARKAVALGMALAWGLRLFLHLSRRNIGRGEDRRYREMRARHGSRWPALSLVYVFAFQALIAWIVGLPLQAAARLGADQPLSLLDGLGMTLFAAGLSIETIADEQLHAFRKDPANHDRVLDTGVFRYTRHPNYFGDALAWWGIGVLGASAGAPWALLGPALMTFLLMRVSGVTLLERTIAERRPEYARYTRTTNAFFPWLPKSDANSKRSLAKP